MSFTQAWDTSASIRQLSSSQGVTKSSVKLPLQHFASTPQGSQRESVERPAPSRSRRCPQGS